LNQPGCYRDVKDTTVTAQFKIKNPRQEMTEWGTPYFIAWTTTPWTLPSNTALCVGPKIDYVCVQTYNSYTDEKISIVMAEALVGSYLNPAGAEKDLSDYKHGDKVIPYRIVGHYKGSDLIGMEYDQLMPYVNPGKGAFRVIGGDYVSTEDGTGIVHIAPTFGADDAFVAKQAGVPALQVKDKKGEMRPLVDLRGRFYPIEDLDEDFVKENVNTELYAPYAGRYVKNAYDDNLTEKDETLDIAICMDMKQRNQAFRIEKHVHSYPHCWRTDKPVLYYPLDSWFIKSSACKERMMELNKNILWKPESTGSGRFGKWLENLNDWNLSRSRYWGTPLPIWCSETGEETCIGSIEELYSEIEKSVAAGIMAENPLKSKGFVPGDYSKENYEKIDLHRPYVDDIILVSESGKPMKRESDLIDVWFDSGSMPYAQLHYPFENKELVDNGLFYPADFIAEGVDQTRGWFFTLHAIACMVFDSVAFKAVISNGLVLDKNGSKMSKRLGNAVDPFDTIEKYGSDPVRWYMLTNSAPWDNLKFDVKGVEDVSRAFFGKLYQTYSFLAMYANVDQFDNSQEQISLEQRPEIDRWILSDLHTLIKDVTEHYEDYELTKAGRIIEDFVINDLSNWYVRLNRKRFWGSEMTEDKISAYQCLYQCLETISRLMAPIAPFYADQLYCDLTQQLTNGKTSSVHLADFPKFDSNYIDVNLENRMKKAQKITSMILSLRKKHEIIVRQPLQCVMIPVSDENERAQIEEMQNLIKSEVNVREIRFVESIQLEKTVKCNFRIMGKKFGKLMNQVSKAVSSMSQEQIGVLDNAGQIDLSLDSGDVVTVMRDDVEIFSQDIPGWSVANEGTMTVALDLEITEDLKREGIAREIVKRIQTYRKEHGFEITDHIRIVFDDQPEYKEAILQFKEYICSQVLCNEISFAHVTNGEQLQFDNYTLNVIIDKL
jgi:isoleucyl-tRNA synthetase